MVWGTLGTCGQVVFSFLPTSKSLYLCGFADFFGHMGTLFINLTQYIYCKLSYIIDSTRYNKLHEIEYIRNLKNKCPVPGNSKKNRAKHELVDK